MNWLLAIALGYGIVFLVLVVTVVIMFFIEYIRWEHPKAWSTILLSILFSIPSLIIAFFIYNGWRPI
jgi:uncharacterized membrane protein